MNIAYTKCDGCDYQEETEPIKYGGHAHNWITVKKTCGSSHERLNAGKSHFCSEACLTAFMTGQPVPQEKEKKPIDIKVLNGLRMNKVNK